MMTLYHSPLSPYVRKVMVTAHEVGLADKITPVDGSTTPLAPNDAVLAQNPVGKIPALVTEAGQAIFDSRVICRYLNQLGGGDLYAGDEIAILTREALAEGMTDAALLAAYEGRLRPAEMQFAPWVEGQRAKVMRGAEAFEARVDEVSGPLRMDQIALGAALGYIDFRHADLGWREVCPKLAAWYAAFSERPAMQATAPG